MNNFKHFLLSIAITSSLAGCASNDNQKYQINKSYLELEEVRREATNNNALSDKPDPGEQARTENFSYIDPLSKNETVQKQGIDLTKMFSETDMVSLTVNDLALSDFLHYVLGDLLEISYILGDKVVNEKKTVTFNFQEKISQRKLYLLCEEILAERGYILRYSDGIYYIHKSDKSSGKGTVAYGYGSSVQDVPNTSLNIIQIAPFKFGMKSQIGLVLKSIAKVKVTSSPEQNALILNGKRSEIVKALEFLNLMDQPYFLNRHIGIYKTVFVSTDVLEQELKKVLVQEGISVSERNSTTQAVSIVSLDRIGAIIFFANDRQILQRVEFWAEQLDLTVSDSDVQYFIYQPEYSRAIDLNQSIQSLIGGDSSSNIADKTSAAAENANNKKARNRKARAMSALSGGVRLVVDERANSLIFECTGDKYRQLLPLIKRLDVLPKQIILEVVIAEVTLSDEFKFGVEFALNNGSYSLSTMDAFGTQGFGGLSYLVEGTNASLALNMFKSNSLVNILSRPSLVVRDGVQASINVGTDIPIVGSTITDPTNGTTQSVEYRKTGVEVVVTPTINAQGVVIMEVQQSISNEVEGGSTVADSPSIFERSITTEVVAESGQTAILGGLVSETRTRVDSGVPFFSSLPLVGGLFKGETDSGDKTELVIFITPKIIQSLEEWDNIKAEFDNSFNEVSSFSEAN